MGKLIFLISLLLFCQVRGQSENPCACCTPDHGAFDFWVGEWKVTNTDGSMAGTNTIVKIEDGCVLRERWKGAGGTTGTSTNFYNGTTGQWEQLWVDNTGFHLKLKGNLENGQMILSSEEFVRENGERAFHRISWIPNEDGTVRQLWEIVKKNKEVSVAFDGLYRKIGK